jgi:hypothetical protein
MKTVMMFAVLICIFLPAPPACSQQADELMREGDLLWQARAEEGNALSSIDAYKRVLAIDA